MSRNSRSEAVFGVSTDTQINNLKWARDLLCGTVYSKSTSSKDVDQVIDRKPKRKIIGNKRFTRNGKFNPMVRD